MVMFSRLVRETVVRMWRWLVIGWRSPIVWNMKALSILWIVGVTLGIGIWAGNVSRVWVSLEEMVVVEEENDGNDCSLQDVIARTRSKLEARCLRLFLVWVGDKGFAMIFLDGPRNISLRPGKGTVGLSLGRSLAVLASWSAVAEWCDVADRFDLYMVGVVVDSPPASFCRSDETDDPMSGFCASLMSGLGASSRGVSWPLLS